MKHFDLAVVGGGVVGLSIAYQMLRDGGSVVVLERGPFGREASWAGAGILPDCNLATAKHPLQKLTAISHQLHQEWAIQLESETGISTEMRKCGTVYLARTDGEVAALIGLQAQWDEEQLDYQALPVDELQKRMPTLASLVQSGTLRSAAFVPGDIQIRNPRHLEALQKACQIRGGVLQDNCGDIRLNHRASSIESIESASGEKFTANHYCVACGSWSGKVLEQLSLEVKMVPIRGQMLLYHLDEPPMEPILFEGARYAVARHDGHILIGSTVEDAGFDKSNTDEAVQMLAEFAGDVIPALKGKEPLQKWAGLRPSTYDGFPYLGTLPKVDNGYIAAGHFRSGLHQSTGTAVAMCQLMRGETPDIDLSPFRVGRG